MHHNDQQIYQLTRTIMRKTFEQSQHLVNFNDEIYRKLAAFTIKMCR